MFQLDIKEARTGKIQLVNNMRSQNMFQKQILNDCQSIRFEIYFKMNHHHLKLNKMQFKKKWETSNFSLHRFVVSINKKKIYFH